MALTLTPANGDRLLRRQPELLDRKPRYRLQPTRRLGVRKVHRRGMHRMLRPVPMQGMPLPVPVPAASMFVRGRGRVCLHVDRRGGRGRGRVLAGHGAGLVDRRGRALGACGRDGDGVGVVLGRDRVASEVVQERGLGGDGDVDGVEEEAGGARVSCPWRAGERE